MRIFAFITLVLIMGSSCENLDVKDSDVFSNLFLSSTSIPADGQTTIQVSVDVKEVASSDRRNFIFSTTAGSFSGSGNSKITAKAEYYDGLLKAKAVLVAPVSPVSFSVTVQPEFDSPIRDFVLYRTAEAIKSVPNSIDLETSSVGITTNFASEVFLTGLLKNKESKNVSKGIAVLFEDKLTNGDAAGGRFRNLQSKTLDSSKVSTYYAAANHAIGTTIIIYCTVLNEKGERTAMQDDVSITINK